MIFMPPPPAIFFQSNYTIPPAAVKEMGAKNQIRTHCIEKRRNCFGFSLHFSSFSTTIDVIVPHIDIWKGEG